MAVPRPHFFSLVEGVLLEVVDEALHVLVQLLAEVQPLRGHHKILVMGRGGRLREIKGVECGFEFVGVAMWDTNNGQG